jgi:hypothetical protein
MNHRMIMLSILKINMSIYIRNDNPRNSPPAISRTLSIAPFIIGETRGFDSWYILEKSAERFY